MSTTYLIHHGLCQKELADSNWAASERASVNPFDAPLSEKGREQIENLASNIEELEVIYTSPFTRAIETALHLKKFLNKDVAVRVEYGLAEAAILNDFTGVVTPQFINGQFVKLIPNHVLINNRTYYSHFDDELMLNRLYERYPELDSTYNSKFSFKEIPFSENDCEYGDRTSKVLNIILKQGVNTAVVGHKGLITLGSVYLRQNQTNDEIGRLMKPLNSIYFGDKEAEGVMVKFSGREYELLNFDY